MLRTIFDDGNYVFLFVVTCDTNTSLIDKRINRTAYGEDLDWKEFATLRVSNRECHFFFARLVTIFRRILITLYNR